MIRKQLNMQFFFPETFHGFCDGQLTSNYRATCYWYLEALSDILWKMHIMWYVRCHCVDYWSESDQEEVDGSMTLKQESSYHCNPAVSLSLSLFLSLSVLSVGV